MTRELYGNLVSLQFAGIFVGVLLVATHAVAVLKPDLTKAFLKDFPRHREIGIAIMALNFIWTFWLVMNVDLGEFYTWEKPLKIIIPVGFFLVVYFVDEFLAARALGMFMLLLACPVLEAAFQRPPASRLLLSSIAYVWIVLGLFWVGMPYTLRDQITWVSANAKRWTGFSIAGLAYGIVVLVCAFAFWGGVA